MDVRRGFSRRDNGTLNPKEAHRTVSFATRCPALFNRWTSLFYRPVPNLLLRMAVLLAGLAFIAFGVALSRATGTGTLPISCVPAVLSFALPFTIGTFTFVFNLLFVAA